MNERPPSAEGPWLIGLTAGALVICLLAVAYGIGWSQGRRDLEKQAQHVMKTPSAKQQAAGTAPKTKPAASGLGKQLFAAKCGVCHTLSAAGTGGTVGPNLDQLGPDTARVLAALRNGGTGSGTMPKNLYTGKQAQQVANFVSQASGG